MVAQAQFRKGRFHLPIQPEEVARIWRSEGLFPLLGVLHRDAAGTLWPSIVRPLETVITLTKGELAFSVEGFNYILTPGDELIIPAHTIYTCQANHESHWLYTYRADGYGHGSRPVPEPSWYSTLNVIVCEGKDLPAMDLFGLSDPVLTITHARQKQNTSVRKNTQNPVWNESFDFTGDASSRSIEISVEDKDTIGTDKIGDAVITLDAGLISALKAGTVERWVPLSYRGEAAGKIRLLLKATWGHTTHQTPPTLNYISHQTQHNHTPTTHVHTTHVYAQESYNSHSSEGNIRPTLGVEIKLLDDQRGGLVIVVHDVRPDGPAHLAGIRPDDIIEQWENIPLSSESQFAQLVQSSSIGQVVMLIVRRGEQRHRVPITIAGTTRNPQGPKKVHTVIN
eukprot:NODE_3465_length_1346_cov_75.362224_g3026_i0.p1 GENE.NODE_3465_length_1346_cov_75.362224_g3026_i0~~NODE_3465_length_1346_cov_75.362224_g3026_i0.p1  ORF type:complete len:411 (-),score=69.82 NODE_3465_length_1346_cov_75.362224_g3026_i0:113-1300(-)